MMDDDEERLLSANITIGSHNKRPIENDFGSYNQPLKKRSPKIICNTPNENQNQPQRLASEMPDQSDCFAPTVAALSVVQEDESAMDIIREAPTNNADAAVSVEGNTFSAIDGQTQAAELIAAIVDSSGSLIVPVSATNILTGGGENQVAPQKPPRKVRGPRDPNEPVPAKLSKYRGVTLKYGKWQICFKYEGIVYNIGCYEEELLASQNYEVIRAALAQDPGGL